MITVYYALQYYLTLFLFGLFGLTLNLLCLLLSVVPPLRRAERFFQRLIHHHFRLFLWWMTAGRIFEIRYLGQFRGGAGRGLVLVANHPGLMDITYLLAYVAEAVCIFKPAIRRNPVLGAAARCAGYLSSDGGIDLVRQAAEKVAAGHCLVVFPEGTRTPHGGELLPFKPGFALIAKRAGVPIQLVRIACDSNALTRGRSWWALPDMPIRVEIEFGPVLETANAQEASELARVAAAWFQSAKLTLRRDEPLADECRPVGVGASHS